MRSSRSKISIGFFLATILITALLGMTSPAWAACRDLEVARPWGSVAHAAEAAGEHAEEIPGGKGALPRAAVPYLNEPWYC